MIIAHRPNLRGQARSLFLSQRVVSKQSGNLDWRLSLTPRCFRALLRRIELGKNVLIKPSDVLHELIRLTKLIVRFLPSLVYRKKAILIHNRKIKSPHGTAT